MSFAPQTSAADAIVETLQLAQACHQAGRHGDAESLYRAILELAPQHGQANHQLGLLYHQLGRFDTALDYLSTACNVSPQVGQHWISVADCLLHLGRRQEARQVLENAIQAGLDHPHSQILLDQAQDQPAAIATSLTAPAPASAPDAELVASLRALLSRSGQHGAKQAGLHQERRLPESLAAVVDTGDWAAVEQAACQALVENPFQGQVWDLLGSASLHLHHSEAATLALARAAELLPDDAEIWDRLAMACQQSRQWPAAEQYLRKSLELLPSRAETWMNLGTLQLDQGQPDAAIDSLEKTLALRPDLAEAQSNLGMALAQQLRMPEAIARFRQALALKPELIATHSNLICTLDLTEGVATATLQHERRRWDQHFAQPLRLARPYSNSRQPQRRLRIGYVSADFHRHSAAFVFGAMLVHFDPSQFEVFAYSNTRQEDEISAGLRARVSTWRHILDLSDEAVAELIRQDQIDILVDLSGHSPGNRLLVFARKPAPIQISAWGYATSTGMTAMDVFFADPVVLPVEEQPLFTEEVRYLPNLVSSYFPMDFPPVNDLPAQASGVLSFGSFNRLAKTSDTVFGLWAQLLLALPHSRLLLKTGELDHDATRQRVAEPFLRAGVAPERLVLQGKTSWFDHLRAYNQIDIALDPFPHGGGVTTLETLRMGVPSVTLRGDTIAGRVSASILHSLGLDDWIADSPQQYLELAAAKAADLPALAALRRQLRPRFDASPIGDGPAYVSAVEQQYRLLWQRWCQQESQS